MGQVWLATEQKQGAALASALFVATFGKGFARVYKHNGSYGLEVALGPPIPDFPGCFRPTKALRKLLKLSHSVEDVSLDEFSARHVFKVARKLSPEMTQAAAPQPANEELPAFVEFVEREGLIMARYD